MKTYMVVRRFIFMIPVFMLFSSALLSADNIERHQGNFVLKLIEDSGAFSLGYQPESGSYKDFFSSYDAYASTYLEVKIGSSIYRLNRNSSVQFSMYEEAKNIGFSYYTGKDVDIQLNFSFCPGFDGVTQGAVKVEITVFNNSAVQQQVSLKGVFDTILGENSGIHFLTSRRPFVDTEISFNSMDLDKWIRSSDGNVSVQFLLNGTGITVPQTVVVANKDMLDNAAWEPVVKPGRSFNSVFSYNNSAVCILWAPVSLTPMTKSTISFYLSYAANGQVPPDTRFLGAEETISSLNENNEIVYQDENGVTYTVGALTAAQLDPKYIEDLLNRIRRLEDDPEHIDRIEILRLNAELDAILEKIRRQ